MKTFFGNLWDSVKDFAKMAMPFVIIPAAVITLDVLGALSGGLLSIAVLSGVAFVVSLVSVSFALPAKTRAKYHDFVGHYSWILDLVATVFLTVIGFHMGVTMGLSLMVLGLNWSLYLSAVRVCRLVNAEARAELRRDSGVIEKARRVRKPAATLA